MLHFDHYTSIILSSLYDHKMMKWQLYGYYFKVCIRFTAVIKTKAWNGLIKSKKPNNKKVKILRRDVTVIVKQRDFFLFLWFCSLGDFDVNWIINSELWQSEKELEVQYRGWSMQLTPYFILMLYCFNFSSVWSTKKTTTVEEYQNFQFK